MNGVLASFAEVCCASCAEEHLVALAPVRTSPGVRVLRRDGRVWIRWETDEPEVLRLLLPIPAVVLYAWREGRWHRFGKTMPDFDGPPDGIEEPLYRALFPAPVRPLPVKFERPQAIDLRLERDDRPRPATALLTTADALLSWADGVPTARLERLHCVRRRQEVLVLGTRLPALAQGERYWGTKILTPLGYRLEPELNERTIRAALDVGDGDLLLVCEAGVDIVPGAALQPLRRASLRRLVEEAPP